MNVEKQTTFYRLAELGHNNQQVVLDVEFKECGLVNMQILKIKGDMTVGDRKFGPEELTIKDIEALSLILTKIVEMAKEKYTKDKLI
jgi:hypothetical protein